MKHLTLVHYMVRSASYQKNEGGKCRCSAKGHTQPTLPTFFCSECAGRTLSEGHLRSEQVGGDHLPRNLENEQRRRNRRDAAARQTQQSFSVVSTRDRTAIRGSMCQCLRIGSTLTANAIQGTASPVPSLPPKRAGGWSVHRPTLPGHEGEHGGCGAGGCHRTGEQRGEHHGERVGGDAGRTADLPFGASHTSMVFGVPAGSGNRGGTPVLLSSEEVDKGRCEGCSTT